MLYAILCYDTEPTVVDPTGERDAAMMKRIAAVEDELAKQGRLGPVARLSPARTAKTLRKDQRGSLRDGPFAETKEQFLGFFVVECATEEEAVDAAVVLGKATGSDGAYEIRPIRHFVPGRVRS
jgi:hypothetical protein